MKIILNRSYNLFSVRNWFCGKLLDDTLTTNFSSPLHPDDDVDFLGFREIATLLSW